MLKRMPQGLVLLLFLCGFLVAAEPGANWLDVPFVKQTKDGCGAASIAMVMQYWAAHDKAAASGSSDPDEIFRTVYSPRAHGIYASKLEGYLKQNGFRTFVINGTWADLQEQIGKGRPLIVALKPGGGGSLHYVVVAGLDTEQNLVMMNDPAERKLLKRERAGFEKEWSATNHWMLLAVPNTSPR